MPFGRYIQDWASNKPSCQLFEIFLKKQIKGFKFDKSIILCVKRQNEDNPYID